jgi:sugar transferase (PEP-CTERM/EpsH1 system associated)
LISPWLPWPPFDGGRIRILETLRFLGQRHRVTLLAHIKNEEERSLQQQIEPYCDDAYLFELPNATAPRLRRIALGLSRRMPIIQSIHNSSALAREVLELTTTRKFDIIHVEFSFLAHYINYVSSKCAARRVLSTHNIESERFQRELSRSRWGVRKLGLLADTQLFRHWEEEAFRAFDGITVVSTRDQEWARRHQPLVATRLVPNGVDVEYFSFRDAAPTHDPSIVFTGVMDYPPNEDAVIWFAESILPGLRATHPELRFNIVGARAGARVHALQDLAGVTVTGEVPDIRPYVREASVFVAPLRSGGGTRLKILQAMATGCPVVSTSLGAEGLDVANGRHLLIANDPDAFTRAIDGLLKSPTLSATLSAAARKLVIERYDWQACLSNTDALYRDLLS